MLKNTAPTATTGTTRRVRRLRKTMSLPEVILWEWLRHRPAGLKFRRQHPSGPYILNFYCNDARLAVEIGGEAHCQAMQANHDGRRDRWFANAGIKTLRIAASDVLGNLECVTQIILAEVQLRLPIHHPALPGGPPPRGKLEEE
jgi:very-short-patch-repair endonuclease